jgi:hypothetical protein
VVTDVYLSAIEAAEQAGVTKQTIINWCRDYGIGWKIGGQWCIDPDELAKVLDGSIQKELERKAKDETYY